MTILVSCALIPALCASGLVSPQVIWEQTYTIGLQDLALDVIQTHDGGYAIAGIALVSNNTSYYDPSGQYDAFLLRTDTAGNVIWYKKYGNTSSDGAHAVRETRDGGFIIAGYASAPHYHDADMYLILTDSGGNVIWEKHYERSPGFDALYGVCELPDGDFIVAGETDRDQLYGIRVAYLARIDQNGDIFWEKLHLGNYSVGARSLECRGDDGYLVGLYGALVRTNNQGDVIWTADHDTPVVSARFSPDGGAIATGITESPKTGYPVLLMLKTDSSGRTVWETLSPDPWGFGRAVEVTADNGFLAIGTAIIVKGGMTAEKTIPYTMAITLLKTQKDGFILWNTTLSPAPFNQGMMVRETSDGGYIVLGSIADEAGQEYLYFMGDLPGRMYLAKLASYNETSPDQEISMTIPATAQQQAGDRNSEGKPGLSIPLGSVPLAGIFVLIFILGRRKR